MHTRYHAHAEVVLFCIRLSLRECLEMQTHEQAQMGALTQLDKLERQGLVSAVLCISFISV
jgi:hypothetical protein